MSGHLYRDGKIWYGWYYNGQGHQIRKSTRCTDRRAAEAILREWERRAANPASVPPDETTVDQALTQILADRRAKGRSWEDQKKERNDSARGPDRTGDTGIFSPRF